jgi:hypothetical protein
VKLIQFVNSIYEFLGSIVGLASVMTDAQTAFDNCMYVYIHAYTIPD